MNQLRWLDDSLLAPMCAGGVAGLLLVIVGLLFVVKLMKVVASSDVVFWKWWGTGLLTRMILLLIFALVLMAHFSEQREAALLSMIGVYLIGMFIETAWLAKYFCNANATKRDSTLG